MFNYKNIPFTYCLSSSSAMFMAYVNRSKSSASSVHIGFSLDILYSKEVLVEYLDYEVYWLTPLSIASTPLIKFS